MSEEYGTVSGDFTDIIDSTYRNSMKLIKSLESITDGLPLFYNASKKRMNQPPIAPMNTDKEGPLYKEESDLLIACAMAVHNSIGHGFHEKPYENALVVEFRFRGIAYEQQRRFDIRHRDEKVGEYVPDLLAFGKIVVDTKVIEKISESEIGRMINYLKATGYRLGYIINFKHQKLQWKRVIK